MHQVPVLARFEGEFLLNAPQALIKGALETEVEVAVIAGVASGSFDRQFDLGTLAGDSPHDALAQLLRQHGARLISVPHAGRALMIAAQSARLGKAAIALIPNHQIDETVDELNQILAAPLDRGSLCIVLEDAPQQAKFSCPRRFVQRLNIPAIEPSDLIQIRDGVGHALRLSRAARGPAAMVVHVSILRSAQSVELRPNRVLNSVDAMLAKRRRTRSLRWSDASTPLRVARRLELNRFRATPSPGERVPTGFITIGPADQAMLHINNALGLHGRVPVLQLGLINPIDESAVMRMLTRCQRLIVLEPRAGSVEPAILATAEALRQRGGEPATIWGQTLPGPDLKPIETSEAADSIAPMVPAITSGHGLVGDLHPSILVRKIVHLLHAIRPTGHVNAHLVPERELAGVPAHLPLTLPARDAQVGSMAALASMRRLLTDVDQWLRERAPLAERGIAPSALAIDGSREPLPDRAGAFGGITRIVQVEVWEHRQFQHDGIAAVVHAAREQRPWIIIACESASNSPELIRDLERIARGAIPAEHADRVVLETANFNQRIALRDLLREAAMFDGLTIVIVRDGPPAQFDVPAMEQSLAEIDRLGFEPRQRLIRRADEVCALRVTSSHGEDLSLDVKEFSSADQHTPVTSFSIDPIVSRSGSRFFVRIRPLIEEVEVIRTRPPVQDWKAEASAKLPLPQPLHAREPHWRAHMAGYRGAPPGIAAWVLCQAGQHMGYHVRCVFDPTPIAMGVRAWAQVLFTRSTPGQGPLPLSTIIPYGEADLLIALDEAETLRALGPDVSLRIAQASRTCAVANLGAHAGESDHTMVDAYRATLENVTRSEPRLINDFDSACSRSFHTDRVSDMTMLGAAFQLGCIPLSLDAMDAAIAAAEVRGVGRAREAFEFGRRLAHDPSLFTKAQEQREEELQHLTRRIVLSLSRGEWGGGKRARNFSQLLQQSLAAMPGLAETDSGRVARRDFVTACHHSRIWGGFEYAQRYANLIVRLYRADRGDTGRALTRFAILPLAEAMLIRDPLYIASMASSPEQRRQIRQRLNVKLARGDRIERRYLTRLEMVAFSRRIRAEVRTSDWPARTATVLRRLVPNRFRGSTRERDVRAFVVDLIQRAIADAGSNYEHWLEAMRRLHDQAAEDRLRGMALAELKMLAQPPPPPTVEPVSRPADLVTLQR